MESKTKTKKKNEQIKDESILLYKNIDTVLHESMIPYSEHVILDRALPRVEDGLKPVQRRILYAMYDLGITPDKEFKKSARIVGECLGKYHPHGDSSVYDAMVRMAQNFNMGEILVEGHGNYGSIDGDSAAAMRYTEAKLAPLAMEMLKDLEKDTVSWSLNFDDTLKEPDMLPAAFPNLLVNGGSGIAVGLATNIPTHNLNEVIDAVVLLIDKKKATLDDVMKVLPAPDFPTGANIIVNGDEIKQAYETGKGKITLKATTKIENNDDKKSIVITELPYQVNKVSLLQKIAELKEDKGKENLAGIQEIRDESDRNGMRAVIKLKKDANAERILNYLNKYSNLETGFYINMVAIADGKPKQLGLMEILKYYLEYRKNIIIRRSKYDLEIAKERAHLLEGLVIALKNIDKIIKLIKSSANTTEAKKGLVEKFKLTEKQAQAILDMRLAKLTNLEKVKIEEELKELKELIANLTKILNSEKLQYGIVKKELIEIKKKYKTPRRTKIIHQTETPKTEKAKDEEIIEDVVVTISANGNIKSIPAKHYQLAQKTISANTTLNETHKYLYATTTNKTAYIFTNLGYCYKIPIKNIAKCKLKDKGTPLHRILEMAQNEKVVYFDIFENMAKNANLFIFTKNGMVKKSKIKEYNVAKSCFQSIQLKENDEVINCQVENATDGFESMILVSKEGYVLNAKIDDITESGRITVGIKAINLGDDDSVIFAGLTSNEGEIITITNKAYAKRTIIPDIEISPRNRKGVKISPLGKENGTEIAFASIVKEPYSIMVQDINEMLISKFSEDIILGTSRQSIGKSITRSKVGLVVSGVFIFNKI